MRNERWFTFNVARKYEAFPNFLHAISYDDGQPFKKDPSERTRLRNHPFWCGDYLKIWRYDVLTVSLRLIHAINAIRIEEWLLAQNGKASFTHATHLDTKLKWTSSFQFNYLDLQFYDRCSSPDKAKESWGELLLIHQYELLTLQWSGVTLIRCQGQPPDSISVSPNSKNYSSVHV